MRIPSIYSLQFSLKFMPADPPPTLPGEKFLCVFSNMEKGISFNTTLSAGTLVCNLTSLPQLTDTKLGNDAWQLVMACLLLHIVCDVSEIPQLLNLPWTCTRCAAMLRQLWQCQSLQVLMVSRFQMLFGLICNKEPLNDYLPRLHCGPTFVYSYIISL